MPALPTWLRQEIKGATGMAVREAIAEGEAAGGRLLPGEYRPREAETMLPGGLLTPSRRRIL